MVALPVSFHSNGFKWVPQGWNNCGPANLTQALNYYGWQGAQADAANWLSMFNADSIIVDRKTGFPRTIHVPQAAVCVTGGIQPGILRRVLGTEHRESGLAARQASVSAVGTAQTTPLPAAKREPVGTRG